MRRVSVAARGSPCDGVALLPGLGPIRPRLRGQADQHTERLIQRFSSPDPAQRDGLA